MLMLIHSSNISVTRECLRRLQWHSNVVMGGLTVIINIGSTHWERLGDVECWDWSERERYQSIIAGEERTGENRRGPGRSTLTGENNLAHTEPGICLSLTPGVFLSLSFSLPPSLPPSCTPSTHYDKVSVWELENVTSCILIFAGSAQSQDILYQLPHNIKQWRKQI